jgi:hypothetical protein
VRFALSIIGAQSTLPIAPGGEAVAALLAGAERATLALGGKTAAGAIAALPPWTAASEGA